MMARLTKPPTYTVTALATALGVAQPQVSEWKRNGMPFKAGRIGLADAVAWLRTWERRERKRMSGGEAVERRAAAEAELAELKLARERGDVVPAAEVLAAAEDEATRVAGVLSQIPSEFAPVVAARLGVTLRQASAVLREVADGARARLAAQDEDGEQAEAA